MPVKTISQSELRKTLLIAISTGSPEERAAAAEALARLNKSEPAPAPEITEPVVLGELTVSAEYAKELRAKHGSLGTEAAREASGEQLRLAAVSDNETFAMKFPDSQVFYDDVKARSTTFWRKLDADAAKIEAERRAKRPPVVEPKPEPVPVEVDEYPPFDLSPLEKALALRAIMRGSEAGV